MNKRIIALCLVLSALTNLFFIDTTIIFASENKVVDNKRHNYHFIETEDISNIYYTYEENEKTYHVHENLESDFSKCETKIYVVDGNRKRLVEEYTTYVTQTDSSTYLEKYANGHLVKRDLISQSYHTNTRSTTRYEGMIYYEARTNRYFTGWFHAYTDSGYNNVTSLSLSALAIIIATAIGVELKNPSIAVEIFGIAQGIIDKNIEVLYWVKEVYEVYQIHYPERTFYGSFIGQRIYATIYSDSSKTTQVDYRDYEYIDPVEWPSITIGPA